MEIDDSYTLFFILDITLKIFNKVSFKSPAFSSIERFSKALLQLDIAFLILSTFALV